LAVASYSQSVWELDRELEDDERASTAFLALGGAGMVTWFATLAVADSLLPVTSIAALLAVIFGVLGWRASKQGTPREATNFVAVALTLVLAVLWLFLLGSLVLRLGSL
jgi:predicted PurR-regulated permease PerM